MELRPIASREQPEVLIRRLQEAVVVETAAAVLLTFSERVYALLPQRYRRKRKSGILVPCAEMPCGVPHGVVDAVVYARRVRVQNLGTSPMIFFCPSVDYKVLGSTIRNSDNGLYPHESKCLISSSVDVPNMDGHYDVCMRVSVNGSVKIAVEEFVLVN